MGLGGGAFLDNILEDFAVAPTAGNQLDNSSWSIIPLKTTDWQMAKFLLALVR
jgi:hypothetical protein